MWQKVDVSKNVYDEERQFFFEMKEGYELSCVIILIFAKLLGLFEILYTSSTVKTSKNVVKSGCF